MRHQSNWNVRYWCITRSISSDRGAIGTGDSRAWERRRDAATAGASERERTTGGHIWSRGPRGSQVTLASDGASRFHDDVLSHTRSPPSIWEFCLPPFFPPRHVASRLPRAGRQKYRRLFRGWERDERRDPPSDESRREALFRDYRGLPAFWNRADPSSPFPISSVSSISRVVSRRLTIFMIFQGNIGRGSLAKLRKANSCVVRIVNVSIYFYSIRLVSQKFFKKTDN